MKLEEKTVNRKTYYQGKILNLRIDDVELPNGSFTKREIVEHKGGVAIIPIDGSDVILVNQFRYAFKEELLEIPAGKREVGEEPIVTAKRELFEEIGATAEEFIFLGEVYPTVGYCEEKIYIYVAKNLHYTGEQHLDENEFLNVCKMNYKEALKLVRNNEIKDGKTIIGLLMCGEYFD